MFVALGIGRFAYPALIPALIEQRWFSSKAAHAYAALNLAGYLIGALLAPAIAKRTSVKLLIRSSLVATSLSFVLFIVPSGLWWYAAWRFISGISGAIVMICVPPLVLGEVRPQRRGWATGIIFTGIGSGIMISGALVPALMKVGLSATWVTLGVATFVMSALVWGLIPDPPSAPTIVTSAMDSSSPARSFELVALGVAYCCYACGFIPHTIFFVEYIARGLNRGTQSASQYWVLFGAAALAGAPLAGMSAQGIGFRRSLIVGYAFLASGVLVLTTSTSPWTLVVSSVAVGISFPALTALTAGRLTELVHVERRRQVWSMFTLCFSGVYALTGFVATEALARIGSYRTLFSWSSALLTIGFLMSIIAASTGRQKA